MAQSSPEIRFRIDQEERAPVDESVAGTHALAVHDVNATYLTALAKHAASKAHQEHIEAGRLAPSNTALTETPNS